VRRFCLVLALHRPGPTGPLPGGATTPTTSLSSVIGLGPCCGGGDATFSSGLPGAARVSDLTASQFQTLCTASRGDTAGLDQYCKIPGLEAALAAPATASDSALVSACQASYATCTRSSPKDSPSACASVTTSTSCYVRVDELEACLNEMTALGAAYGPSLPDCATLTRASLGGVDQSLLIAAPSCGAIGGCTQILTSP
jgi:hypothetical protein